MPLISEVAIVTAMLYFPILLAAMLLVKPVLERKYDVKIKFSHPTFYEVSGGTPTQRFVIQLSAISLALVGVGLLAVAVMIIPSPPKVGH
jgi:hypothetical protein